MFLRNLVLLLKINLLVKIGDLKVLNDLQS